MMMVYGMFVFELKTLPHQQLLIRLEINDRE